NNATKIPEGIVTVCTPEPLLATKSGPHTAVTDTAIHIAVIASEPHTSRMRRNSTHWGRAGPFATLVISHLLCAGSADEAKCRVRWNGDRWHSILCIWPSARIVAGFSMAPRELRLIGRDTDSVAAF